MLDSNVRRMSAAILSIFVVLSVSLAGCASTPAPTVSPAAVPTPGSGTVPTPSAPTAAPTSTAGGPPETSEASASPGATAGVETVSGVVIDIQQSNPVTVTRFTIRTIDDRELTFTVGDLDLSDGGFRAGHLREHQATTQPVLVDFRREGQELIAVRLEDDPR